MYHLLPSDTTFTEFMIGSGTTSTGFQAWHTLHGACQALTTLGLCVAGVCVGTVIANQGHARRMSTSSRDSRKLDVMCVFMWHLLPSDTTLTGLLLLVCLRHLPSCGPWRPSQAALVWQGVCCACVVPILGLQHPADMHGQATQVWLHTCVSAVHLPVHPQDVRTGCTCVPIDCSTACTGTTYLVIVNLLEARG